MSQNLHQVDWNSLPAPVDDGGADHLPGTALPEILLQSTDGNQIDVSTLAGTSVIFAFPRTGRPDQTLPEGWDMIPGARGCTPQACAFRDLSAVLKEVGVAHLFGLSTQPTEYQREAAGRLHLPFPLLSDDGLQLASRLGLPCMDVEGMRLLKRLTMIIRDGTIEKVFYPVFPPDRSADDVLNWLTSR